MITSISRIIAGVLKLTIEQLETRVQLFCFLCKIKVTIISEERRAFRLLANEWGW